MSYLELKGVNKIYPNGFQAVYDFDIKINKGDFVALLGPSGCGKTTTLRMLAGLEEVTSGEILLEGRVINNMPPKDRDVAMVFQDYALYPNMTVYDNIGFSLIIRGADRNYIHERVIKAAQMLDLVPTLRRRPHQLSGGQRQRVALGRTIVRDPKLFLMDEPMSNLDAKLRNEMRVELIELHQTLGATTIYVTHDQIEAMTMANVIVVMSRGYVQQIGSATEIYDKPNNLFVASFIGVPTMTLLEGRISDGRFSVGDWSVRVPASRRAVLARQGGVVFGLRPEYLTPASGEGDITFKAEIVELIGHEYFIHGTVGGAPIIARIVKERPIAVGELLRFDIDFTRAHFFDGVTTERIKEEDDGK